MTKASRTQLSLDGKREHRSESPLTDRGVQPQAKCWTHLSPGSQHHEPCGRLGGVAGPTGSAAGPPWAWGPKPLNSCLVYLLSTADAKRSVHHTGCVSGPSLLDAESLAVSLHSPVDADGPYMELPFCIFLN